MGNIEEAKRVARSVVDAATRALGPWHQDTMNMRRLLIHMLMQTGDIDESETMALDQYGLCIEHLDGEPKTRMESALALFNVAAVREDLDQMRRWAKELEGSEFENGAEELIQNVALTSPVSKSDDALKD